MSYPIESVNEYTGMFMLADMNIVDAAGCLFFVQHHLQFFLDCYGIRPPFLASSNHFLNLFFILTNSNSLVIDF